MPRYPRKTPPLTLQVETDQDTERLYTRYSADNWTVQMGESDEPHDDCAEIEALYQQWIMGESQNPEPKASAHRRGR